MQAMLTRTTEITRRAMDIVKLVVVPVGIFLLGLYCGVRTMAHLIATRFDRIEAADTGVAGAKYFAQAIVLILAALVLIWLFAGFVRRLVSYLQAVWQPRLPQLLHRRAPKVVLFDQDRVA